MTTTVFKVDDIVVVTRPDSGALGVYGIVIAADPVWPRTPRPQERVRVEFVWPGSKIERPYTFKATELALVP